MIADSDLDAVFAAIIQAAEVGERIDPAEWTRRYPRWEKEIAEFCGDLRQFQQFLGLPHSGSDDETTIPHYSASSTLEAPDQLTGERFGDYDLIEILGGGGMGQVFRARRVGTELIVALKRLHPERAAGDELMHFLAAEVNSAASLNHPHIVTIYHFGEHAGQPYFTMELVTGGNLHKAMARFHGDPIATVKFMIDVARAVHFAHQRGILHRDLKPANILLDEHGSPRVADFGLATKITDDGEALTAGDLAGTVRWMAPEAIRREPLITTAVDIWALGVILYEMLTGRRPFSGESFEVVSRQIQDEEPLDPRSLNSRLDWDLSAICMRCLRKDPEKRYESAAALANDLERWQRGEMVRARPLNRAERFTRWCRRHPAILGTIVFVGLMLLAVSISAVSIAHQQEARLRSEVGQANQFAARHVAGTIQAHLQRYGNSVMELADRPELQRMLQSDPGKLPAFVRQARDTLNADPSFFSARSAESPLIASLFVLDEEGIMLADAPVFPEVISKRYSGRDYYLGALRRARKTGIDRVYISRVYRSDNDHLDKLAIAVAVRDAEKVLGVIVATITTDATLGLGQLHDAHRKAVLLAPRDTNDPHGKPAEVASAPELLIVLHPAYKHGIDPIRFTGPQTVAQERIDCDYRDPVAEMYDQYEGRWIAAFAPIGNTELVVIVQQRYDEAIEPVRGILRRTLMWLMSGLIVGLLLLTGTLFALRHRS